MDFKKLLKIFEASDTGATGASALASKSKGAGDSAEADDTIFKWLADQPARVPGAETPAGAMADPDVYKPAPKAPAGPFANVDAFVQSGMPKGPVTVPKTVQTKSSGFPATTGTPVTSGSGQAIKTGSGGTLKTRAASEFGGPQDYYRRIARGQFSEAGEESIEEKAVSKQQQKFMGMVHAMQKGEKIKGASPELKKVAKTMSKKAAKDFASTKHKGLPKKVTEDVMLDEGGNALKHISNRFKHEVKNFMNSGFMDEDLYDALYDYYTDTGEMPYAVAKARTGDPHQWVEERFYQDMGSGMSESSDMSLNELARLAGLKEVATTYPVNEPDVTSAETYPVPTPDVEVGKPFKGSVTVSIPGGPSATVDDDLEEDQSGGIQVHNLSRMSGSEIYDETQTNDNIKDGDVIITDTGTGIMVSAWPVVVSGNIEGFHRIRAGLTWEEFENGQYLNSAQKAMEVAGSLDEEFANAPDEEYHSIASITRQGNDLNREKRQFANKPKLGDNPMATNVSLDEELSNLLDSILVPANVEEGIFDTDADLQARSPQYKALKSMEPKYKGTQYEPQLKQRIDTARTRAEMGAGEVMDYDPKTGKQVPRAVVPPEQYKAK